MSINYIAIGQRIRKFRSLRNMTQERLAELANLTPTHVSHIETGNTKVSLPSLLHIAMSLDVTLDDLVYENLAHTKHVSMKEIDALLSDCSDIEARALVPIIEAAKMAMRSKK